MRMADINLDVFAIRPDQLLRKAYGSKYRISISEADAAIVGSKCGDCELSDY